MAKLLSQDLRDRMVYYVPSFVLDAGNSIYDCRGIETLPIVGFDVIENDQTLLVDHISCRDRQFPAISPIVRDEIPAERLQPLTCRIRDAIYQSE